MIEPYYYNEEFNITIYHGDCREVIPQLEPVDLILSDPPYGINYATNNREKGHKMTKPVANDKDLSVVAEVWPSVMALLKEDRHWYAFASPRRLAEVEKIYGKPKQIIAWDKGNDGTMGDLKSGFAEAWEAICYGMKGRRELRGKRSKTIIRYDWSSRRDPVHPTIKPVPLLRKLIEFSSDEGEVVFDPFMGSGTTLMAAKKTRRGAVGIELEEEYCELAADRLHRSITASSDLPDILGRQKSGFF